MIDPVVERRIQAELSAVERDYGVKILMAVESGSRAWGFPSADSDYDVRFIYVHPPAFYLTVFPKRDVIEKPIDDVLDVSGWDLRKALGLMLKSNAALLEWLQSPVHYRDGGHVERRFLDLARGSADLTSLAYHYDRQARRGHDDILAGIETVRLKTYFYALRSSLALMWLRVHGKPPPMDLASLMAGLALSDDLRDCVTELLEAKRRGTERDTVVRRSVLDDLLVGILAEPAGRVVPAERGAMATGADAFLAEIVLAGGCGSTLG